MSDYGAHDGATTAPHIKSCYNGFTKMIPLTQLEILFGITNIFVHNTTDVILQCIYVNNSL